MARNFALGNRSVPHFDRSRVTDELLAQTKGQAAQKVYQARNLEDAVVEMLQDRKSLIGETVGSPGWRRREGRG